MWDVRHCTLASLERRFAAGDAGEEAGEVVPDRLIVCRQAVKRVRVEALAAQIRSCSGRTLRVVCLSPGGWKGVLRNVPNSSDGEQEGGQDCATVVAVGLVPNFARLRAAGKSAGPILVLVGLKYRGNVGTIVRSAVQANFFEAIYIIEDDYRNGDSVHSDTGSVAQRIIDGSGHASNDEAGIDLMAATDQLGHLAATREWAKLVGQGWARAADLKIGYGVCDQRRALGEGESACRRTTHTARDMDTDSTSDSDRSRGRPVDMRIEIPVSDEDISYYSMLNAPLIEIRRFRHSAHFFAAIATVDPHCVAASNSNNGGCVRGGVVGIDGGTIVSGSPDSLYSAAAASTLRRCGYVAVGAEDRGNHLPYTYIPYICINMYIYMYKYMCICV